ncbi:MAG: hypothetical protein EON54_18180 [Alcaligenaceae bacterium]|nr:MAG: hypothetical protein EON54_18180 [Alcaligenaceae bacterium]
MPKHARRIAVRPEQRGAKLPPLASSADIRVALDAYLGKRDATSQAIARAIENLLNSQQRGTRR